MQHGLAIRVLSYILHFLYKCNTYVHYIYFFYSSCTETLVLFRENAEFTS